MKIKLIKENFEVVDTKEKITIADSFVVRQNKIGSGNGEAKLYIGQNNQETREFFGNQGFSIPCFLLKKDLLKYLEETKVEYLNPEQPYVDKESLPVLWNERKALIEKLPEKVEFTIIEQTQISGPRVYVKSDDTAYKWIRKLSLPNITYISVIKLSDKHQNVIYYFRLFADYFGEAEHPYIIEKQAQEIEEIDNNEEKRNLKSSRVGQGKYREQLLADCPFCPITLISDDRLLIASHIKPWAKSNDFEKTDPKNGFMLTPTFDLLFDRGFLSFTDDRKTILSPFLSRMTYSKLKISDGVIIPKLPIEGRESYLEYHRNEIFK